jgi:predicted house-cleaning noncanonical NTP pyrophosphatase (MazG superfamily)
VSNILYAQWSKDRDGFIGWATEQLESDVEWAISQLGSKVILRSSATDETIKERGQFLSLQADLGKGSAALAVTIDEIFAQYAAHPGQMCLILQRFVTAAEIGFLSNELRLMDKPYRWIVEAQVSKIGQQLALTRSISAKQAKSFPSTQPLMCVSRGELLSRLKSVALHFWKATPQRTLLEWCWDGNRLWIVQRDIALPQPGGKDPSTLKNANFTVPTTADGATFRRYEIGSSSPWAKLRNVSHFATDGKLPPHRLFFATAANIEKALGNNAERLILEINALTGSRCVLRTDTLEQRFNLNRTNTIDGAGAVAWMQREIELWRKTSTSLEDVIFILHAYIPAAAAAWSYYKRGGKYVRIDGLWGLADGMQYYPTDTYICDPLTGCELSVTQRFKDLALFEQPDGTWQTERIDPRYARYRALTKADSKDIAVRTVKIANNIQKGSQIMWFVGVPKTLNLGDNLPWFKVNLDQSPEERRSKLLSSVIVKDIADLIKLDKVKSGSCKVVLEPIGEDLRSDTFINAVSARCKDLGLPVEVRGSILGHAYHQLLEAGVVVFTAEPSKRIIEVRQRKAFDKLVRDQIPDVIASKGELVHADELEPKDLRAALIGKLLEEAGEFLSATGETSVVEELSDILEVVRGLTVASNVSFSDVIRKADEKVEKRGGFSKGVILRSTEAKRRTPGEPQLFPLGESRNLIRLDSLRSVSAEGPNQEIPLSLLMTAGPQEITLQVNNKLRITVRLDIKAAKLIVEVRAFEANDSNQPSFL